MVVFFAAEGERSLLHSAVQIYSESDLVVHGVISVLEDGSSFVVSTSFLSLGFLSDSFLLCCFRSSRVDDALRHWVVSPLVVSSQCGVRLVAEASSS